MKVNPTRELHKTLVGATALELLSNSNLWMFAMVKVALKVSKVWFPGKNSSVRFEILARVLFILKEVWQGRGKQDVLADVGLTWRVTP